MPHTEVEFGIEGDVVSIRKAGVSKKPGRRTLLVERLRGRGDVPMTKDEIMALTREIKY